MNPTARAITAICAAGICLQTIRNSFEISPALTERLQGLEQQCRDLNQAWPGKFDWKERQWCCQKLEHWAAGVKKDIRLGDWVMSTLSSVAVSVLEELSARPTTAFMKPHLTPLILGAEALHRDLAADGTAGFQASELASEIVRRLRESMGWKEPEASVTFNPELAARIQRLSGCRSA